MKKNKLLWLLFGVFLMWGVSMCDSSENNHNNDKLEIDTSSGGGGILPEVLPTTPTSDGEAPLVDDAKAGAVMTGKIIGSTGGTDADRSFRYKHIACLELHPHEKPAIARIGREEGLTPSVCMAGCYEANRVGAFMIRGDVCICMYNELEISFFLRGRKPGLCRAPCSGDSTAMCGGRTAYSLLRLLDDEDVQEDLSQPSVDEVTQLAGSGTTVDGPTDPKTAGSIGAGAASGGSISHAADGDGDRDIAAAADFGDDPREVTVEAANLPDDAETETDADMTINDPGSAKATNTGRSSLHEYMGCLRLSSAERRDAAVLPQLAEMTPTACIQGCRNEKAVMAALMRGGACMCAQTMDPDLFVPEREPGVCASPCNGDATLTCGGEDSLDVFRLLYEGDSEDNLSQPSVDEVARQAGPGTFAGTSHGPSTDRSVDEGARSIGSASPTPKAATGATDIAAAAPEFSDDPQVGTVEALSPTDSAETETDVVVKHSNSGEAKDTSVGSSALYEHMGCVRLDLSEKRVVATIPPMAEMTPTLCIEVCRYEEANLAGMVHGNVCMCASEEDPDSFRGRDPGICKSPCVGDATLTCGGKASFDVFKLSYEKDNRDTLPQPSVDEVAQQAGSGTTTGTSNGPSTDASMDDGAGSISSASPSPEAATGATSVAAVAPESSGDSQVGTVEDSNVRDVAKAKTEVVVTGSNPGSTKTTNAGRSTLSKHMGCLRLDPSESRAVGALATLAEMTPTVCIRECRHEEAVLAAVALGDVCMCAHDKEADNILVKREPGVCASPCVGDATLTCGGEDSIDLFKLSYEEDSTDTLLQPSVDEAAQQAGSGTSADTSNDPSADGSMDDGEKSMGSASPSPEAATGATDVAAAAPEFSDDPQVGTVEALSPPGDEETETDVVVTDDTSGSAEDTSADDPSLYEYMGCLRLNPSERRAAATIPPMAMMTPVVCTQACGDREMNLAVMVQGNVCMCAHKEDPDNFLRGRDPGICESPCDGDATRTCGGGDSLDVLKLSHKEENKDTLPQPSVDEVSEQAGSGTTTDTSNGPSTDEFMDDGWESVGSTSPPPEAATGATDVSSAAPEFSDDPPEATVEDNDIRDDATAAADAPEAVGTTPQDHIPTTISPPPASAITGAYSNQDIFQSRTGTVHLKGSLFGWGKRELSIVNEDKLRLCKAKRVWNTGSCEEASLDDRSEIVAVLNPHFNKRKGVRHPFRVTSSAAGAKSSRMWTLDAGSEEEMNAWVSLLKGVVARARAGNGRPTVDDSNSAKEDPTANNPWDIYPPGSPLAFRGSSLSPSDLPLQVGQFLSTLPRVDSANLAIRENGDVLLRRGDKPTSSSSDDPIWVHRATESFGDSPNGGLGCALQSFWDKLGSSSREDAPVHLRVKNGRWRVGRGALCTMGQSPKPAGSWRRHLPWDARGQAIKKASLELRGETLVVASGEKIFWSSSPSPQRGGGLGLGEEGASRGLR